MTSVGSFEAKANFPQLLERVAHGERILIIEQGMPVAMLVPPEESAPNISVEVGREMLAYRDQVKRQLSGSFRELAHKGHNY